MSHLQQESFQIIVMVPLLPRSAIASMRQKIISQGRTNREGALLRYSCKRGAYYSVGRTNREGRTDRGSTVIDPPVQKKTFSGSQPFVPPSLEG